MAVNSTLTADVIAEIIGSICEPYVLSKEGRTLDTDSIGHLGIAGIDTAAREIVNRLNRCR